MVTRNSSFTTAVLSLLFLVELTTCTISSLDGNISSTTPYQYENISSNGTSTKSPPVDAKQPSTDHSTSEANGLRVLYRMTSTFLDVIQPPGKNLYDELHLESAMAAKPNRPLDAVVESFSSKAQNDPKYFIRYWVGFAVCVAFGLLFIVLMPLVALSVCLCRCCCHRCGHEKRGTQESPTDKPKRICLAILLFFLSIVILAGTVCAFLSNELVGQQTSSVEREGGGGGGGVLPTILRNLGEVDAFKRATVKDVHVLLVQLNSTLNENIDELKGLPDVATARLLSMFGTDLIGNISTLNHTLVRVRGALGVVGADSEELRILYSKLNQSLTVVQYNLSVLCYPNNMSVCQPPALTTASPDPNQMPNISSQLMVLDSILSQGFNVSTFEDISRRIAEKLQSALDAVSRIDISGTLMNISSSVKSTADSLDLKPLMDGINRTKTDVDKYGSYRFNVCVAISCLLLLIVLLIFIGLCIGVHSKPPYDIDLTSGVTRWTAAQFLMASVVIMFIFCSVLMAIVIVLFVSGGIVYTDGCRGFDQQQDNALVKIADSFLRTKLGNVSLYGALRDCKSDAGIVEALNLDEKFHISDRFDLSKELNIGNGINISSIDLSNFHLSGPKTQLERLRNSSLTNINFTAFNELLNDTLLRSTLTEAISNLNKTAHNASVQNTTVGSGLLQIVQQLQNLSETIVVEITDRTEHLRLSLKKLNETLYIENSTESLADFLSGLEVLLDRTENQTKYDAPRVLQQLVNDVTSNVQTELIDARTKVLTGVGRCRPLSNAVESSVAAVCHSTLDPYNAFWFGYGWCVFLFIPTTAIAVVLAQLYWRLEIQPRSYSEASGYDAYKTTYPEEYLRLHNLTASHEDPRRPSNASWVSRDPVDLAQRRGSDLRANHVQGLPYSSNPGYVDYGDTDHSQGPRPSLPNTNGIDFYRGVGRQGNGSYDNPTYVESEPNSYRIPRPTTAHVPGIDENTRHHF